MCPHHVALHPTTEAEPKKPFELETWDDEKVQTLSLIFNILSRKHAGLYPGMSVLDISHGGNRRSSDAEIRCSQH